MNIAIICNRNQARSQFLRAVLSKLLTEHYFESFGLVAQEGAQLPIIIESIFTDTGLTLSDRSAKNIWLHWNDIQNVDLVIAVTSLIADTVFEMGFTGKILNLEFEATLLGIELVDPQLMPRRQCKLELAKYFNVTFSALLRMGYFQGMPKIRALIPERENLIAKALEICIAEKTEDSIIIYGDLVAPRNDFFKGYSSTKYRLAADEFHIDSYVNESQNMILLPAHSVICPSKVYLSAAWFTLLQKFGKKEISLITPPFMENSEVLAESYLAAVGASQIQVVR
jgi:protein-tyrosine-phosphatase